MSSESYSEPAFETYDGYLLPLADIFLLSPFFFLPSAFMCSSVLVVRSRIGSLPGAVVTLDAI